MAKIVISLSDDDIGDLLLGDVVCITPNVKKFDNLSEIVIQKDPHNYTDIMVEDYELAENIFKSFKGETYE